MAKCVYNLETKFVSIVPNGILKVSERMKNPRECEWKSIHLQDHLSYWSMLNESHLEWFLHLNLQVCIWTTSTLLNFSGFLEYTSSMQENMSLRILNENHINPFSI